jgi:hypothetical protein
MSYQFSINRRDALFVATTLVAATTLPANQSVAQTQPTSGAPKLATGIPPEITMPNRMDTRVGTLRFSDRCPDAATIGLR